MLVLTRYRNESVVIEFAGITCEVIFVEEDRGRIKLGFDAPREVSITRKELVGTDRAKPRHRDAPGAGFGWGPQ